MLGKELKHLSRKELVDIIYQLKKIEDEMKEEIESLKKELEDKHFKLSVAGSIADASVSVTNLFATAQMTADLYLQEIEQMKEETEKECARLLKDAKGKAEGSLEDDVVETTEEKKETTEEKSEVEDIVEEDTEPLKSDETKTELDLDDIFASLNEMKQMFNKESCEGVENA